MTVFIAKDYRPTAHANEEIFRNILRDLKQNGSDRYGGRLIPADLQTEIPIDEIYRLYSTGDRYGKFTIMHCDIESGQIWFAFETTAGPDKKGAQLHYVINGTDVRYTGPAVIGTMPH